MSDIPSMRRIGAILRKLRLRNNDLILVKNGSPLAEDKTIEAFVEMIARMGILCGVVTVKDFDDLKVMSDKDLARIGLIRLGRASRIIYKRKEEEGEEKTE